MGALKWGAIALLLALASPALADPLDRWEPQIAEASARYAIPETWIRRVMRAESGGRTELNGRPIQSRAGAMGLMQLMPATWEEIRFRQGLGADPYDPRDNILAGASYLRVLYDRFGYPGLFAAYNAGPARLSAHLASGRRLPAETIAYVADVTGERSPFPRATASPPPLSLFIVREPSPAVDGDRPAAAAADAAPASLFVRLEPPVR